MALSGDVAAEMISLRTQTLDDRSAKLGPERRTTRDLLFTALTIQVDPITHLADAQTLLNRK